MNNFNPLSNGNPPAVPTDFNSRDPLVNDMLGNAYHIVREVYLRLGDLTSLYDFLKQYGLTTNVAVKSPVEIVANTPITLSGSQEISWTSHSGSYTVTANPGMRVLVTGQIDKRENGIYIASLGLWKRSMDFDGLLDAVNGTLVFSTQGDAWQVATSGYIVTIGTDPITFNDIDFFAYESRRIAEEAAALATTKATEAALHAQAAEAAETNAAASALAASQHETNAAASATQAAGYRNDALNSATSAKTSATSAANSASLAESSVTNDRTFATVALGIAGVADGQYFRVPQGTGSASSFIYYQRTGATATAVSETVGKAAIDATNVSIGRQMDYYGGADRTSFEIYGDDAWDAGTIGTWAVGFVSTTDYLNRIDMWMHFKTGPHHVNFKVYQRAVDAPTDLPQTGQDTLLHSATILAEDLPMNPTLYGYWQRVPFRFPTVKVAVGKSVMIVVETCNADGTHVQSAVGRLNQADVSGLTGSQRGYYSNIADDPATLWKITNANRIAVAGFYESPSAKVNINKGVDSYDVIPAFEVTENDTGWWGISPDENDYLFFAWQKGFPNTAGGTYDSIKMRCSNVPRNRRINYTVGLRRESAINDPNPFRYLKEDREMFVGVLTPSELANTNEAQDIILKFNPITVPTGWFLVFDLVAEGVTPGTFGHLGSAKHTYTGVGTDVRPTQQIVNGMYRRTGGWLPVGAPWGIACSLGTAALRTAKGSIAGLKKTVKELSAQVASNTDNLRIGELTTTLRDTDSPDWLTTAFPDEKTYSNWIITLPMAHGLISKLKLYADGLLRNVSVTLTFWSRLDVNKTNGAVVGTLQGDKILKTQVYTPAALVSSNAAQWVDFPFDSFNVDEGSFLLINVVPLAASNTRGYFGVGLSTRNIPPVGQRGWYQRRDQNNYTNIVYPGSIAYEVTCIPYVGMKNFVTELSAQVKTNEALRMSYAINRYYPVAKVDGLVVSLAGSTVVREGTLLPLATGSITLDASVTGTETNNDYTLKYVANASQPPATNPNIYIGRRHLSNVVVTRNVDGVVLTYGVDYNVDADAGRLRGLLNVGDVSVTVTYTYARERYDLLVVDPHSLVVEVTKGIERDYDVTEYLPARPAHKENLYSALVVGNRVTLVPLHRVYQRSGSLFGTGDDMTILNVANRRALSKTITRVARGENIVLVGYGDSLTAQSDDWSPQNTPNGESRDTRRYLGITYPVDTMNSKYPGVVPNYGDGSTPSNNHLMLGWNWRAKEFFEQKKGIEVKYLNYGIAGTTSTDGASAGRMSFVLASGGNLMVLCFGMNDGANPSTYTNMVNIITQAINVGMEVIVMPIPRTPESLNSRYSNEEWLRSNRYVYLAARDAGAAYIPADWLTRPGVGGMALAEASYCNVNLRNHPGGYEMLEYGKMFTNFLSDIF